MKYLLRGHKAEIANHLFQILLVTYLIILLIEQLIPGYVSTYLNLNYFLVLVIIAGIVDIFSEHSIITKPATRKDFIFVYVLGILGFAIIKFKTADLGFLSWVISLMAGVLIVLLSTLILKEDSEEIEFSHKSNNKLIRRWHSVNELGKIFYSLAALILVLGILTFALPLFTPLYLSESFRIAFGSVFILFIPGLVISYIFFPNTKSSESSSEGIDFLERIALSFALSIAIVPIAVFYTTLIGVKITSISTLVITSLIVIISLGIIYFKRARKSLAVYYPK